LNRADQAIQTLLVQEKLAARKAIGATKHALARAGAWPADHRAGMKGIASSDHYTELKYVFVSAD
jgi:hypothetical protein